MSPIPQTEPGRIFPPVTPELYNPSGGETRPPSTDPGRGLLDLAAKKLTYRQKYLGHDLNAEARAARLLGLHKGAVESEMAGVYSRADFFWQRFHGEFSALASQDEFWNELAQAVSGTSSETPSPSELRQHIVEEVFIGTHLAFYEAHAPEGVELTPNGRASLHFGYVKALLPWVGLTGAALVRLLRRPLTTQMEMLFRYGLLNEAMDLAQTMAGLAPEHAGCQEELAHVHFMKVVRSLSNDGGAAARNDEKALAVGIKQMEQFRSKHPYSLKIFHLLGHLYVLRSVRLARIGLLSEALVDAQKAIAYRLWDEEVRKNRNELIKQMEELQANAREMQEHLAGRHSDGISARAQLLLSEAAKGFGPLEEYLQTLEPSATAEAYRTAQGHTLWRDLGLPPASDYGDERAKLLLEAVEGVLSAAPADEQTAYASWRTAAAGNADLAFVDETTARNFLRRQLSTEAEPSDPAGEARVVVAALPLSAPAGKILSRPEPFGYWIFSREHAGTKTLAAVALLLLLFAGGLWARESWARSARDAAYRQVVEATAKRQYQEVLDGAESFLSHPPLKAEDGRRAQVLVHYKDALVRFVMRQDGGELSTASAERVARYRRLAGATE